MAYENHRSSPPPRILVPFAKAFLLKLGIADRQHLVDNQNFRLQMRGNGECKPNVHAGGVPLDGRIENRSTSAKATISSNFRRISLFFIPRIAPLRKMFSRPVSSLLKPV